MLLPVAAILSTTTSSNSGACTQQPNGGSNSNSNICDRRKRSASALNANCCSCTLTLATTATASGVRLDWGAIEGRRWAQRRRRKRRKIRCSERTNNLNQHSDVKTAAGNYTNIGRKAATTTTTSRRALRNLTNIVVIIKRRRQVGIRSRKSGNGGRIANCISCWMLPQASVTKRLETATTATTTATSSSIATALIENAAATTTKTTKIEHITTSSGKVNDETLATTATTVKQQQYTQHQWTAQPKQNQLKQQQQPVVKAKHLTIKQLSSAAEKHKTQQQQPQESTAIPTKIALRRFDYLIACSQATTPAANTNTTTATTKTTRKVKRHTNHFGSTPFSAACTLLFGALFALSHALQTSTASGQHTSQNMQNSQVLLLQHHNNGNNNNNNNNDSYNMSANEYNGGHSMPLEIPMDVMNSSSSSDVGHNNNNYGNNNITFKSLSIIDGLTAETETNTLPAFDFGMPRNITARTGQTEAIIKCRVDRLDDKSVSWIRKRDLHILTVGTATYTSDKRFQVTESKDSREWTLHVKAPQARDSGIYECQVNTEPKVSMAFQLNIIEISPDSRAIISGPADLHFKVGSAIILSCHVQQPSVKDIGPIYWYRGEHIITPFDADAVDDGDDGSRANSATAGTGTATVAAAAADAAMQHDDIATNDITQDFTTRIAMESQLGDTLKSRLRISNAQTTDTGNYTCQPTTASSASVMVHVINDENPAAMQKSSANALYKLPAATTTATTILLTTITLIAKATSARTLQTAALIANTCRRLYSKHRCHPHSQQQQQWRHEQQQQRLHIHFVVVIAVVIGVVVIIAGIAAAANLETAMTATAVVAVIAVTAAGSQVGQHLVATLLIVAATVSVLVVAIVPLSGCDVALLMSPLHALLALAVPLFVVSASRIILR